MNKKVKAFATRGAALCITAGLLVGAPAPLVFPAVSIEAEAATSESTKLAEWAYTQDDTDKTITLSAYNGTEVDVQIPAHYEIDGVEYTIVLPEYDYQTGAGFKTGTIENLSFETGFKFPEDCYAMFHNCSNLKTIDLSGVDTSAVADMYEMFCGLENLTSVNLTGIDTSNVISMGFLFSGCYNLTSVDVSSFDTSNVYDMQAMFNGCFGLRTLDLSNFDTSSVVNMRGMFCGCSNLTELNISGFNTGKVKNMSWMFDSCHSLTSIDLSGFDTGNVFDMSNMFSDCTALTQLDLSNLYTGNVKYMRGMFHNCYSLTSLNLTNLETWSVNDMRDMFSGCMSLKSLDLTSFDTRNIGGVDRWGVKGSLDNFLAYTNLNKITLGSCFVVKDDDGTIYQEVFNAPSETESGKISNGTWGLDSENADEAYSPECLALRGLMGGTLEGTWYAQSAD